MLREFLRTYIFEHCEPAFGALVGAAQTLLIAWLSALQYGPAAVSPGPLLPLGLALMAANALAMHPVSVNAARPGKLANACHGYLALCFAALAVASALVVFAAGFALLAVLLALTGAPPALEVFRIGSLVVAGSASAALGWGFAVEARRLEVTRLRVAIPGLDSSLAGLRIAQLSDLHIGNGFEGPRLERLVERVSALEADLVVLTGDLFDGSPHVLDHGAQRLGELRARLGVFAILGNHDVSVGADRIVDAFARQAPELRILRDEQVRIATEAPLYLVGVEDPGRDWTRRGCALAAIDRLAREQRPDGPAILLVHRPDAFPQAARLGFPLVLAGHFHGGQLALDSAGRWNVGRMLTPYDRGLYRAGESILYVSRGLGFAGPRIRLNSVPEIALIELEPSRLPTRSRSATETRRSG